MATVSLKAVIGVSETRGTFYDSRGNTYIPLNWFKAVVQSSGVFQRKFIEDRGVGRGHQEHGHSRLLLPKQLVRVSRGAPPSLMCVLYIDCLIILRAI